jgi:hypothetical protein
MLNNGNKSNGLNEYDGKFFGDSQERSYFPKDIPHLIMNYLNNKEKRVSKSVSKNWNYIYLEDSMINSSAKTQEEFLGRFNAIQSERFRKRVYQKLYNLDTAEEVEKVLSMKDNRERFDYLMDFIGNGKNALLDFHEFNQVERGRAHRELVTKGGVELVLSGFIGNGENALLNFQQFEEMDLDVRKHLVSEWGVKLVLEGVIGNGKSALLNLQQLNEMHFDPRDPLFCKTCVELILGGVIGNGENALLNFQEFQKMELNARSELLMPGGVAFLLGGFIGNGENALLDFQQFDKISVACREDLIDLGQKAINNGGFIKNGDNIDLDSEQLENMDFFASMNKILSEGVQTNTSKNVFRF